MHTHLLSTYYMPGIVLGTRDRGGNKIDKILALLELRGAK